jgi:CubicO group peptidase (beta-lactamase class C family)
MANSSSKTITAAAVLQLAEKNKLDLDEDIREYLCDMFSVDKKITCQQLITHTGGVRNPFPFKWHHKMEDHRRFDRERFEMRVLNKSKKLVSEPGCKYLYSNPGYLLLGKIVECVSGLPFDQYTRKYVFDPLRAGPDQIGFEVDRPENHSYGYLERFSRQSLAVYLLIHGWMFRSTVGKWRSFRHIKHNSPAYGGLHCNMDGMSLFLKDMLSDNPVLMNKETRGTMFEPQTGPDGEILPTTLGWDHGKLGGTDYITRPGGGAGFYSNIRVYAGKMATILLINKTLLHAKLINLFSDEIDKDFISHVGGSKEAPRRGGP